MFHAFDLYAMYNLILHRSTEAIIDKSARSPPNYIHSLIKSHCKHAVYQNIPVFTMVISYAIKTHTSDYNINEVSKLTSSRLVVIVTQRFRSAVSWLLFPNVIITLIIAQLISVRNDI